jgi:hypothetical protein
MKRNEIVKILIKEGFSSKLLATFSDKQLKNLNERVGIKSEKLVDPKIKDAIKNNPDVEFDIEEKELDECGCDKELEECDDKDNLREWVDKLVSKKYPSTVTTKGEITEMIKKRISENETMSPMPAQKPRKGHNGIPEFMSYDEIVDVMDAEPSVKPKVKPRTEPTTRPRTPFRPAPADNPGPNAMLENKKKKK